MKPKSIFIFAGEVSGDLYGAEIVKALYRLCPDLDIYGVGGPKMRTLAFRSIYHMEDFAVMGFVDVLFALPRLIKQFYRIKKLLLKSPPDAILLIDYPGFNLRLARSLFKKNFPGLIAQFVCPSVWAWGRGRIKHIEAVFDALFVIFPFEKSLFDPKKLSVHYVGHPLAYQMADQPSLPPLDVEKKKTIIALFPGSREQEIRLNLPVYIRVATKLIQKNPSLFFVISVAHPQFSLLIEMILRKEGRVPPNSVLLLSHVQNDSLMQRATLAFAKLGTNNLELALHQVPAIVTYGIKPVDLWILKHVIKPNLPHYSIANIVSGEEVYPELITPHFSEEALLNHAIHFLNNPKAMTKCREKCEKMAILLRGEGGNESPADRVSKILLSISDSKPHQAHRLGH